MGDLQNYFSGRYSGHRSNTNSLTPQKYWGLKPGHEYANLNNDKVDKDVPYSNYIELRAWQMGQISAITQAQMAHVDDINKLLNNADTLLAQHNQKGEATLNTVVKEMTDLINSYIQPIFDESGNTKYETMITYSGDKENKTYEKDFEMIEKASLELKNLLNKLNLQGGVATREALQNLINIMSSPNGASLNLYWKAKGDFLEYLIADYLKQLGFGSLVAGKLLDAKNHNRQIKVDDIGYSRNTLAKALQDRGGISVGVKTTGDDSEKFCKELISNIEDFERVFSQRGKSFSVDDEFFDLLNAAKALKIQAKSGKNQSIMNQNVWEVKFENNDVIRKLRELYQWSVNGETDENGNKVWGEHKILYVNHKSVTAEMLMNYEFSKEVIPKYFKYNNLYITSHGLVTAKQWFELPENQNKVVAILGSDGLGMTLKSVATKAMEAKARGSIYKLI